MTSPESRDYVIIGGGVIGLSVAYHLGKLGVTDVLLLERNQITSGTSWHAAGIVGPLRASVNATHIANYATELFPRLEAETGLFTGYKKTGGYWLAQTKDRLHELHRIAAIGELTGIEAEVISPSRLASREPDIVTDDLAGALFVPTDAQANPVDLCMAYAKSARANGVEIRENAEVDDVVVERGVVHSVRLIDGTTIRCKKLLLCAGAWSQHIGAIAGAPVPLQPVEHMYVVTEPMPGIKSPFPVIRDLDAGTYIKGDAGKLVIGGFEPDAKTWDARGLTGNHEFLELPEDWEQFEPFLNAALARVPAVAEIGIQHFMNGPESFTPDSRQLLGESPFVKNFFVAAGMNSTGMMSSAGVGKVIAEWAMRGEAPRDLWDIDISRFGLKHAEPDYLKTRMRESVADVFGMHWPNKQSKVGRDIYQSALHASLASDGAVFGVTGGWERPFWFARSEHEKSFTYSYGPQNWWSAAQRECEVIRDGVALLELSPFGKFDVVGKQSLTFLQHVCANDVDIPTGRTVYGQFLNARGGIEADVTIARFSEHHFRITSGAATRFRDWFWLKRCAFNLNHDIDIADVTELETVIGIVGPYSRTLLQDVSQHSFSNEDFAFGSTQLINIAGTSVRATRLSFSGELGWELSIDVGETQGVYSALTQAGAHFDLKPAGHLALLSCSSEKGFRHWGHELGPDVTPLEAGLGFAVSWDKAENFIGKDALLKQREQGVAAHLLQFELADSTHPIILHDEPIYRDGALVGQTTSGARGFRVGKTICMGFVRCSRGDSKLDLSSGQYHVKLADQLYELSVLENAAYDPAGRRMRG
ncbi:MAG: FAD-dependent oxidoreductase [Pseudomonadota bacterium]